jgi:hypothetical protein
MLEPASLPDTKLLHINTFEFSKSFKKLSLFYPQIARIHADSVKVGVKLGNALMLPATERD